MTSLFEELTAPAPPPSNPTSALDRLLLHLDGETAADVSKALLARNEQGYLIDARTLSSRLRARGWQISQDMVQRYRKRYES